MFNPDNEYIGQLSQLLNEGQQQPMLAPAIMPVNVRPPVDMSSGGPAGPTEDQIKDAEKAQIISAIGGAVSGGIGAYGQANGTGAYAQGAPLGGKAPAAGTAPAATPAATPSPAVAASTYNPPPTDNFGKPAVHARPSYMLQDPAIYDDNAYTGLSDQNRRVQASTPDYLNAQPFTSPTQPTGESTVRHPQLDALYRQYYGQVGLSGRGKPQEFGY